MRITRKSVLISSLSVIVLLALLFLALPPLARHLAIQKIGEAMDRAEPGQPFTFGEK